MAVLTWVERMSGDERARLGHLMKGAAETLETTAPIRSRIDRRESALIVALFLEYARGHELTPAEAESLLDRPGCTGPRALEVLGLSERPSVQPGRLADTRVQRREGAVARTPGRSS